MASLNRGVRRSFALISSILQRSSPNKCIAVTANRTLFTRDALGLNGYEATRERVAGQLGAMKERFKTRMEQYLSGDSKALIFTEDLKNMLYLTENEKDLGMVQKMMKKYVKQNQDMRFGSFVFGPVVMRTMYHLDKPDLAMQAVMDGELGNFFDQLSSYQVLMDLLFEHKRYDDVVKVYEYLRTRPFVSERSPKEQLVLAVAALHRIGTPEALEKTKQLMKTALDGNAPIMRKAITYAASLALKNNDPAFALEILTIPQNQSYITVRNLKALALLAMDRLEDILPLVRSLVDQDTAFQGAKMPGVFSDVMEKIKDASEKKGDKELAAEFEKVFSQIREMQAVDQSTLEEFLDKPIEDVVKRPPGEMGPRFGAPRRDAGGFGGGGRQQQLGEGGQQQQQFQRQPRYPPPTGGQRRQDREDNYNPNVEAGYRPRGGYQRGGSDRDNYNPNAEAGYGLRQGFQRNSGRGRQGLSDRMDE